MCDSGQAQLSHTEQSPGAALPAGPSVAFASPTKIIWNIILKMTPLSVLKSHHEFKIVVNSVTFAILTFC